MVKYLHASALFLVAGVSVVCAAETSIPADIDKAFANYVALPDTLLPIMAGVNDKASADAAADKLYAELSKVYDTRSELQKIANLPPEVAQQLKQKYESEMRSRWGEVYKHIFRLQKARCYDSFSFFKQFHTLCMMLDQ
ncbi:MAG: hypothetical protein II349_05970 [Akkermansia sp.]|nr:hypothetical protein [Akkermansia sp.]